MTVSSTGIPYVKHACTGTTSYAYTFKIFVEGDLVVKRIDSAGDSTTLVITTDYTVADNGDGSGGTVTSVATYSDGHLSIETGLDYTQTTDFVDGGALPAASIEDAVDKNVMLMKQLWLTLADASAGITWQGTWTTATAYSDFDMVINDGKWYICTTGHTSGTFSSDLSSGYWRLFLEEPSSHTVASHSDTTATGAELETLTDDSMADTLHRHSELSASDGTPNQALTVDADGKVTLTSGTAIDEFSIDGTFAGNSDDAVPTEKAVKTYVTANAQFYNAYVMVSEQQTQNTDGGTFTQDAWQTRTINTEDADTGAIASIATNQITLAAGTYRCLVAAAAHSVGNNQIRLYDTTGTAVLLTGVNSDGIDQPGLSGRFTLSVQSVLEIQHYCEGTKVTDGFGQKNNWTTEVYLRAEFWREA